jgi:hypothetical protein
MPIATIRAELSGSSICTASSIAAIDYAPVLAMCRRLLEAGHDPATCLEAYRGETLALRVRSIGEGATLEIGRRGFRAKTAGEGVLEAPTAVLLSCS